MCNTHRILVCLIPLFAIGLCWPVRDKRAFSYIANQTVCVVDSEIYRDGDPIPTDDPCESCKCRPPGFSCVLRECEVKPGCKAIRRDGECCPEYQCGCEHNGKFFNDGDRIPNAESPCYSCYCQGSSITCALADCKFRFDCEPEYVSGECCPRYEHCPPDPSTSTLSTTRLTSIFTTLPTTTLILSTNRTTDIVSSTEEQTTTSTTTVKTSEQPSAEHSSNITQSPASASSPAAVSEPPTATLINEELPSVETTPAAVRDAAADDGEVDQPTTAATVHEENEVDSVVVTAKVITVVTGSASGDTDELVEESYQTTKTWLPDTSLAAEHKESFDDLLVITTEIPAINGDSLESLITEKDINGAPLGADDEKKKNEGNEGPLIQEAPAAQSTTLRDNILDVNDVATTTISDSQTAAPEAPVVPTNSNNSTDTLNINVIVS